MRKTMGIGLIAAATVLLPAGTLTVDDLIGIALRHSPDVTLGRYDVAGSRQLRRVAESVRLPQALLSIRMDRERSHVRHAPASDLDTLEGTLSVTQLLYDFGRSGAEIRAAHEQERAAGARMRQIVSDKILQVKKCYYDALKAKTMIWVYEKNLHLQEKHLYRAQKYLKAGLKTAVDVTDAKLETEKARKSLSDARFLYRMQRTLLEESLGTVPEGGAYRLYGVSGDPLRWKLPRNGQSLQQLLRSAMKNRAVLQGLDHDIRSADARADSKARHYTPILELYGEAGAKSQHPGEGVPWRREKIGVRMNWSLFSGYRESAEAEAARIEALKARAYRQQAQLAIRKEVTQAYLNLEHMRRQFRLNDAIAQQALKKFHQAQKRYVNDLADYIELQDARQDYIRALAERVNSYFDYFIARAELEHAVGK